MIEGSKKLKTKNNNLNLFYYSNKKSGTKRKSQQIINNNHNNQIVLESGNLKFHGMSIDPSSLTPYDELILTVELLNIAQVSLFIRSFSLFSFAVVFNKPDFKLSKHVSF